MDLRETILACDDIEKKTITIKQWNNLKVEVRAMTAKQRFNAIAKSTGKNGDPDNEKATIFMIIESLYDPKTGEKVFGQDDFKVLSDKSSGAIEHIIDEVRILNGLGEEEQKSAEKN